MEKIYVVVYVCVMTFCGDIYTEQKVTRNKNVAHNYFNDYIADIAETTGNDMIIEEVKTLLSKNMGETIFDYEGANGGNMYHVEISEVEVTE
jgi:hypothetical protein